jgi:hypothetical protein
LSAADDSAPLNVKAGLWEITQTTTLSGTPPVSQQMLDRLPPDQRARYEERMKARGTPEAKTVTRKHCVTKEELEKGIAFNDDEKRCLRTVLHSSHDKMEVRLQCVEEGGKKHNGIYRLEASDPDNVKGTVQGMSAGGGGVLYINSTLTAKWVSESCPAATESNDATPKPHEHHNH